MKNDLIVKIFSQKEHAHKAWQALDILRHGITLEPGTSCLVERDSMGRAIVHQYKLLPDSPHQTEGKVLDVFVSALFGGSREETIRLADAGLDEIFLRDVADALQPDKSALVIYIRRDRLVDTHRLLEALALLQGRLHHASFPDEVEGAILGLEYKDMSDKESEVS